MKPQLQKLWTTNILSMLKTCFRPACYEQQQQQTFPCLWHHHAGVWLIYQNVKINVSIPLISSIIMFAFFEFPLQNSVCHELPSLPLIACLLVVVACVRGVWCMALANVYTTLQFSRTEMNGADYLLNVLQFKISIKGSCWGSRPNACFSTTQQHDKCNTRRYHTCSI